MKGKYVWFNFGPTDQLDFGLYGGCYVDVRPHLGFGQDVLGRGPVGDFVTSVGGRNCGLNCSWLDNKQRHSWLCGGVYLSWDIADGS